MQQHAQRWVVQTGGCCAKHRMCLLTIGLLFSNCCAGQDCQLFSPQRLYLWGQVGLAGCCWLLPPSTAGRQGLGVASRTTQPHQACPLPLPAPCHFTCSVLLLNYALKPAVHLLLTAVVGSTSAAAFEGALVGLYNLLWLFPAYVISFLVNCIW